MASKEQLSTMDRWTTTSDKIFYALNNLLCALIGLIVLIPLINIVASSFSSPSAVNSGKVFLWPVDFSLKGYEKVFQYPGIWRSYLNTFFYTIAGTGISIVLTIMAAYPLTSRTMPGRGLIMGFFTFTMMFSGGMVPSFLLVKEIGMLNTVWAMLIPGALSVYNTIVARTSFQGIPEELREAATIDGCDDFRYLLQIVIPLSSTLIAVLALFYAVGRWNDYFTAFLYLSDRDLMPLQMILREVLCSTKVSVDSITDGDMMAAMQGMTDLLKYSLIIVSSLPILILYPFLQRFFVKGVMIGSLKG